MKHDIDWEEIIVLGLLISPIILISVAAAIATVVEALK